MTAYAVMQPYFLPYLGYFQLIAAVDHFVVLDDVQYVKGSWLNRNRIRMGSEAQWFTAPVQRAQSSDLLQDIRYVDDRAPFGRLAASLRTAYARTKGGPELLTTIAPLIQDMPGRDLVSANVELLQGVCDLLGLPNSPKWHLSSDLGLDSRRQRRIAEIGQLLESSTYINLPGGRNLYSQADFGDSIELRFISIRESHRQDVECSIVDRIALCGGASVTSILSPTGYTIDA